MGQSQGGDSGGFARLSLAGMGEFGAVGFELTMRGLGLVIGLGMVSALGWAQTGSFGAPPLVTYTLVADRNLIGVNNPEQIYNVDLGDVTLGNTVIYRDTIAPGAYRNWFSHVNRSGATIGYAIQIRNNGTVPAVVTRRPSGFTTGLLGGAPFALMLNNTSFSPVQTTLNPGQSFWLWRNDNAVPNTQFFNGVIDFDVSGGPVEVDNVAYRSFAALTGTRSYMGYIQRTEPDGTRESRVYKGMTPFSRTQSSFLEFGVTDATPNGPLMVTVRDFLLSTQKETEARRRTYWFTNIGTAQNSEAVMRDMVAWNMPGWGMIDPYRRTDGTGNFPNLGNWGVEYVVRGRVNNRGAQTRTFTLNLTAPAGGGSPIALRGTSGTWTHFKIDAGTTRSYLTVTVPGRTTVPFEGRYFLGGPGAGSLRNTAVIGPAP